MIQDVNEKFWVLEPSCGAVLGGPKPRFACPNDCLRPVSGAKLAEYAVDVIADSFLAKRERSRNLCIIQSTRNQIEYLALACRQFEKFAFS